jgi:CheY-like chemotaxis protein
MPHKEATFLLIEDDEIDIMHLKRSFTQLKIANQMVVANDGIEALDILLGRNGHEALSKPYIILLDLNMPRMNGLEFMAALRAEPSLTSTVVFVLTTSNDEKDKLQAYEKHVAGYILKTEAGQSFIEALGMLDQYWRVVELPTE